jgi:hypothetical protein
MADGRSGRRLFDEPIKQWPGQGDDGEPLLLAEDQGAPRPKDIGGVTKPWLTCSITTKASTTLSPDTRHRLLIPMKFEQEAGFD